MKKIFLALISLALLGFFVLPNLFNQRENEAFSSEYRLTQMQHRFPDVQGKDSVQTGITGFYDRGPLIHFLFGKEYREAWNIPVTFPVWINGRKGPLLEAGEPGGGEQTISMDLIDPDGYTYTLRSVQKDQSRALPGWLRATLARPVFRDQASSLNPYAAPVVSALAESAGIRHTRPRLYYIPIQENFSRLQNELVAGRIMLLEEEPDESWDFSVRFGETVRLLDTEDMLEARKTGEYWADSLMFARCRLFDVIIGDWDRHEGQWAWACDTLTGRCEPLPVDRDMAFYDFKGGVIDALARQLVPKFQSFDATIAHPEAYLINGGTLQNELLGNLTPAQWQQAADALRENLPLEAVRTAMRNYPKEVYIIYGEKHGEILWKRLQQTDSLARYFSQVTAAPPTSIP